MDMNVYCPTCGSKICETEGSKNLRVKCRKCKSNIVIDKDEDALKVLILAKDTAPTATTV